MWAHAAGAPARRRARGPLNRRSASRMTGLAALLRLFPLVALLGVAGCAARPDPDDAQALLTLEAQAVACPPARLLADTAHITVMARPDPQATAAGIPDAYEADMVSATTSCRRDKDRWAVSVRVRATAGAIGAAPRRTVRLPVFVAMTEFSRRVLDKQVAEIPVTVDPRMPRVSVEQTIEGISAPLTALHPGPGYEVLVGFQLTPEQLAANRRRLNVN